MVAFQTTASPPEKSRYLFFYFILFLLAYFFPNKSGQREDLISTSSELSYVKKTNSNPIIILLTLASAIGGRPYACGFWLKSKSPNTSKIQLQQAGHALFCGSTYRIKSAYILAVIVQNEI